MPVLRCTGGSRSSFFKPAPLPAAVAAHPPLSPLLQRLAVAIYAFDVVVRTLPRVSVHLHRLDCGISIAVTACPQRS